MAIMRQSVMIVEEIETTEEEQQVSWQNKLNKEYQLAIGNGFTGTKEEYLLLRDYI